MKWLIELFKKKPECPGRHEDARPIGAYDGVVTFHCRKCGRTWGEGP